MEKIPKMYHRFLSSHKPQSPQPIFSSREYPDHGATFFLSCGLGIASLLIPAHSSLALPPPEDTPEEILRTEIIVEARSPLDGKRLTAGEYAELQAQIRESQFPPEIDAEIQDLIFLLNIRKLINDITPFFDPL